MVALCAGCRVLCDVVCAYVVCVWCVVRCDVLCVGCWVCCLLCVAMFSERGGVGCVTCCVCTVCCVCCACCVGCVCCVLCVPAKTEQKSTKNICKKTLKFDYYFFNQLKIGPENALGQLWAPKWRGCFADRRKNPKCNKVVVHFGPPKNTQNREKD